MHLEATEITIRRAWRAGETIYLLGPGGVGKSTVGKVLAERLKWVLIDLDNEFCNRIGQIGNFISANGYDNYRQRNLSLAKCLVDEIARPTIFVTPSGFLTASKESADYLDSKKLIESGYGIVLLPTLDLERATSVVVERQLKRGFDLKRESEVQKFRERFSRYAVEGDAIITSIENPTDIADTIIDNVFNKPSRDLNPSI